MTASRDWAVITGASSGIGQAFAERFAADGINLVLTARSSQILTTTAARLEKDFGVKTIIFVADLTDFETAKKLVQVVEHAKIRVKYLINNAGFGQYGAFLMTEWEREQAMIDLNITALTYLAKRFALSMKLESEAYIVNLASVAAFFPGPNMAVYYASKAYVLHLSEALSQELSGTGVHVMALCPGPTATKFSQAASAETTTLFKGNLPSAKQVVAYGYRAMKKGKKVAIYGWRNRLGIFMVRLMPRTVVTKLVARFQA